MLVPMSERILLAPLFESHQSEREQLLAARAVQALLYEDMQRLIGDEGIARQIASPDDEERVAAQLARMKKPAVPGTTYSGIYSHYDGVGEPGNQLDGFLQVGPQLWGDDAPFMGKPAAVALYVARHALSERQRPVGLHAFAVREGLARTALKGLRDSALVPYTAPIVAAVHEADEELREAFIAEGASPDGRTGEQEVRGIKANYVQLTLPPRAS